MDTPSNCSSICGAGFSMFLRLNPLLREILARQTCRRRARQFVAGFCHETPSSALPSTAPLLAAREHRESDRCAKLAKDGGLAFLLTCYCLWWLRGRLRLCLFLDQPPPLLLKTVQFHYGLPCYRAVSGSRPWFLNKLLRTSGGPLRLERRQLSETVFRKTDIFKNRLCCSDTRRPVEANVGYITDESAHFWSAQQSPRQCVLLLLRAALQHRLIRGDRTRLLVLLQSRQVLVGVKMPPDIATCPCPNWR